MARIENTLSSADFLANLEDRIQRFERLHPELCNKEGHIEGFYTTNAISREVEGARADLRIILKPFGNYLEHEKFIDTRITTGTRDWEKAQAIEKEAADYLEKRGFLNKNAALTAEALDKMLDSSLASLAKGSVEYKNSTGHFQGLFSATLHVPSPQHSDYTLLLKLRPLSHLTRTKTEYVEMADQITVDLKTIDPSHASVLLESAKTQLLKQGLQNLHIESKIDTSKHIPKHWIDLTKIKAKPTITSKSLVAEIVTASQAKKMSSVAFTLGTRNPEKAENMIRALREEYLPAALANPALHISIDGMKEFLEQKGLTDDAPLAEPRQAVKDIRPIYDASGQMAAQLYTPNVTSNSKLDYNGIIRIAPAEGLAHVNSSSISSLTLPLATQNADEARRRVGVVNDIAEATLSHYFKEHPRARLLLEQREKKVEGRNQVLTAIQMQPSRVYSLDAVCNELHASLTNPAVQPNTDLGKILAETCKGKNIGSECPAAALQTALRAAANGTEPTDTLTRAVTFGYAAFTQQHPEYHVWEKDGKILGFKQDDVNFLDARTLRESILQRPLDYARQLAWQVDMQPTDINTPDGQQRITIKAVRNYGEPLPYKEWDKPFELNAPTLDAALQFKDTIISSLSAQQSRLTNTAPDVMISTDRPVEQFGEPSTQLVLRESLARGLMTEGIAIETGQRGLLAIKERALRERKA